MACFARFSFIEIHVHYCGAHGSQSGLGKTFSEITNSQKKFGNFISRERTLVMKVNSQTQIVSVYFMF